MSTKAGTGDDLYAELAAEVEFAIAYTAATGRRHTRRSFAEHMAAMLLERSEKGAGKLRFEMREPTAGNLTASRAALRSSQGDSLEGSH